MKKLLAATLISLLSTTLLTSEEIKTPKEDNYFLKLAHERHSGYEFDASKPVTKQQLLALAEAARLAPSSYNEQPWVFIICDKTTNSEGYQKVYDSLVEFNQGWAKNAPVLIVAVAKTISSKNKTNAQAEYDTGAAAYGLTLEATSLGLMTHQMGGYDREKISKAFNIPQDFLPMAVIAVGYEAPESKPKQKERKAVTENFYYQGWGQSLN